MTGLLNPGTYRDLYGQADTVGDLVALREELAAAAATVKGWLAEVDDEIIGHGPGSYILSDGESLLIVPKGEPAEAKKAPRNRDLARLVAARASDELRVDPDTGEVRDDPPPPGAIADHVADRILSVFTAPPSKLPNQGGMIALGLDPSDWIDTTWRDATKVQIRPASTLTLQGADHD